MRDQKPSVTSRTSYRGTGTLTRGAKSVPIHAFELSRNAYSLSVGWEFVGYFPPDYKRLSDGLTGPNRPDLSFAGTDDRGVPLTIPNLHWRYRSDSLIEGEAQEVILGIASLPAPPEKQWATVFLSPTPIAYSAKGMLIQSWTGEISAHPDDEDRQLPQLPTSLGSLEFSLRHRYERVAVGIDYGTLQVPVPALHGTIEAASRTADPLGTVRSLLKELEPFLRLLSFLSRQHVRCTEVHLDSFNFGDKWDRSSSDLRLLRSRVLADRPHRAQDLVWPGKIGAPELNTLLGRFLSLPFRSAVDAAMLYLVESVQATFVDVSFVNAFTAFEALITAIADQEGTSKILPSGRFDRVTRFIRQSLTASSPANLTGDEFSRLAEKLPELNRLALVAKAAATLRKHSIDYSDLWPAAPTLEDALAGPIGRRNKYLHAGVAARPLQVRLDALRIHAITERLLYRLLGGLDDWLHTDAYPRAEDFRLMDKELSPGE